MSFTNLSSVLELPKEFRLQAWRNVAEQALNPRRAIVQDTAVQPREIRLLDVNREARHEVVGRIDPSLRRFRRPTLDDQDAKDSPPCWDWFSMKRDIFVIGATHRIPQGIFDNGPLRSSIQTIAIPSDMQYNFVGNWRRIFGTTVYGITGYPELKTIVFLRDDKEQESIPHQQLVYFTPHQPGTEDLRIVVDPTPVSQLELDELSLTESFFEDLVTRIPKMEPGWQLPEFRWGCLVRY